MRKVGLVTGLVLKRACAEPRRRVLASVVERQEAHVRSFLIFVIALSWSAVAQTSVPQYSTGEAVPDHIAFRLFFAAVAENSTASPADAARQDGRLSPMQLTAADKAVLVRSLATFKANLAAAQNPAHPTSASAVVESTLSQLVTQMTPDGFQRLTAYVRSQKKSMGVAFGSPSVSAGASGVTGRLEKKVAPRGENGTGR